MRSSCADMGGWVKKVTSVGGVKRVYLLIDGLHLVVCSSCRKDRQRKQFITDKRGGVIKKAAAPRMTELP
jgi:hypothetical protein